MGRDPVHLKCPSCSVKISRALFFNLHVSFLSFSSCFLPPVSHTLKTGSLLKTFLQIKPYLLILPISATALFRHPQPLLSPALPAMPGLPKCPKPQSGQAWLLKYPSGAITPSQPHHQSLSCVAHSSASILFLIDFS